MFLKRSKNFENMELLQEQWLKLVLMSYTQKNRSFFEDPSIILIGKSKAFESEGIIGKESLQQRANKN